MGAFTRAGIVILIATAAAAADLASSGYPAAAVAADAEGNVYLAGSTKAPDLAVKNAFQGQPGESQFLGSVDGGAAWTRAGSLGLEAPTALAADVFTPGLLYGGSVDGIHKSSDGGRTWRLVLRPAQVSYPGVVHIAADPATPGRVYAIMWSRGLVRSDDGGETWTTVFEQQSVSTLDRIAPDPHGSGTMFFTAGAAMRVTRDGGRTWEFLQAPPGSVGWPRLAAFDPHQRGRVYLATAAGTLGQFWASADYGRTWEARANPPGAIRDDLLPDPERPEVIYASTLGGFARSEDGGRSWKRGGGIAPAGRLAVPQRGCAPAGTLVSATPSCAARTAAKAGRRSISAWPRWSPPAPDADCGPPARSKATPSSLR